ncbi:hypothetical protein ACCC88_01190 [Sphingomonas sp. Sphisp140]|uniref:hypothetical protein n=1 Tax=unclassified Sphingomonas TaxID=196159 RepID=UPI0039AFC3DF
MPRPDGPSPPPRLTQEAAPEPHPLATPQTARASIRIGERVVLEAEARATPIGLIAIGGMVAAILLSVPPILRAARGPHRLPPG